MSDKLYDVAIIGAGAGGITTAIYCARAGLSVALIEKGIYGGQLLNTETVENYTGFTSVSASDLSQFMEEHVRAQEGIDHIYGNVKTVDKQMDVFNIAFSRKTVQSKTLVIATGVKHKKLNVLGEEDYDGRGVSYCAICDGMFFKNKHVAVIGGGDSAVESALYLSNIANKVTLIHRRDELRAENINQQKLFAKKNVDFLWNTNTFEIHGNDKEGVKALTYYPIPDGKYRSMDVDGVFVNIGVEPVTNFIPIDAGIQSPDGFIYTNPRMQTKVNGIYAVGDVRYGSIRQVVSATGDGAMASDSIIKYLRNLKHNY